MKHKVSIGSQVLRIWLRSAFIGTCLLFIITSIGQGTMEGCGLFLMLFIMLFAIFYSIPAAIALYILLIIIECVNPNQFKYLIIAIICLGASMLPFYLVMGTPDFIKDSNLTLILPYLVAVQLVLMSERNKGVFKKQKS